MKKLQIELPDHMYNMLHDPTATLGLIDCSEIIACVKEGKAVEVISDAIIAQEALSFSRGFDAGYHDGYLACGEKYLECIEEIKAEIPKEAFGHWKPDDVVRVDSVTEIIDRKVKEIEYDV